MFVRFARTYARARYERGERERESTAPPGKAGEPLDEAGGMHARPIARALGGLYGYTEEFASVSDSRTERGGGRGWRGFVERKRPGIGVGKKASVLYVPILVLGLLNCILLLVLGLQYQYIRSVTSDINVARPRATSCVDGGNDHVPDTQAELNRQQQTASAPGPFLMMGLLADAQPSLGVAVSLASFCRAHDGNAIHIVVTDRVDLESLMGYEGNSDWGARRCASVDVESSDVFAGEENRVTRLAHVRQFQRQRVFQLYSPERLLGFAGIIVVDFDMQLFPSWHGEHVARAAELIRNARAARERGGGDIDGGAAGADIVCANGYEMYGGKRGYYDTFALIYNTERLGRPRKADPTEAEQILLRSGSSNDEKLAHVGEDFDAGDRPSLHSSKSPKSAATGGRRRSSLGMPTPANRKRRIDDLSPWTTDFDAPSSGGADARFAFRDASSPFGTNVDENKTPGKDQWAYPDSSPDRNIRRYAEFRMNGDKGTDVWSCFGGLAFYSPETWMTAQCTYEANHNMDLRSFYRVHPRLIADCRNTRMLHPETLELNGMDVW